MLTISQITTDPLQQQQVVLPDGSNFILTMKFSPLQLGWFIPTLSYTPSNFTLQGIRIVTSPNLLNQWRNIIPFGLACYTTQNREPTQQQDFASKAAYLYVLTAEECIQYAELLSNA